MIVMKTNKRLKKYTIIYNYIKYNIPQIKLIFTIYKFKY